MIPNRVFRNRKSKKDRYYNGQKKKGTKRQAMIHQILHRKLKIEQHHYHKKLGFNSGDPEMQAVPTNLITFTDIICCYFTMAITSNVW